MTDARGPFADFFGRLWREKPLGIASGVVILILILVAIFADALAPYPFDQLSLAERLQGPSARHLLGTDQLGRDLLSRLLIGARISLVVGLAATTLNVVVATLMEPMELSQCRLAKDISVPPRRINEIVHGKRAITIRTRWILAVLGGAAVLIPILQRVMAALTP